MPPLALKIALKFIFFKESDKSLGFVRKTFILAFFGLSAAIASLLLLNAVGNGYKENIKSKFLEYNPDIEVFNKDLSIDKESAYSIIDFLKKKQILENFSFLSQENGIARLGDKAQSLLITSIIDGNKDIYKTLYSRDDLLCCDNQVIIGKGVQDKIEVDFESEIFLFNLQDFLFTGTVYQKSIKPLLVNSINFGLPEYNNHFAQIDSYSFNKLFGHNSIHKILINLKKGVSYADIFHELESYSKNIGNNYIFLDFNERYKGLYAALDEIFNSISIIMFFLILICLLNILSTISLIVKSKNKQIKILRINGMSSLEVYFIFAFIVLFSILLSSLFALSVSLLLLWLQNSFQLITLASNVYFVEKFSGIIDFRYFSLTFLFLLISGLVLSFFVAYKSSFGRIERV